MSLLEAFAAKPAAAGGAYDPATDTPNLVAWWDFSDTATITDSGGDVTAVNDKGPNNRDLAQFLSYGTPTTGTHTLNGLNVLYFNGRALGTAVSASTIMGASAAGTALYVYASDADPSDSGSGGGPVLGRWGSDDTTEAEPYSDGIIYSGWGRSARLSWNPTPSMATPRQITIVSSSSEWTYKIDGTNSHTTGTNTVAWNSNAATIGFHYTAFGVKGRIAEIIISSSALSGADLTDAQDYLATKWGTA
jgi:hypothetical protein